MHYRGPMRKIVAGALCAPLCLAAACGSGSSDTVTHVGDLNGKTAAQVVSEATAAANKAGAVHYVLKATQGTQTETITGDALNSGGRQEITLGALHIQVVVVNGVAYAKGNSQSLNTMMGIITAQASKYADKWIAVHTSDSLYNGISQAVVLDTALAQLTPGGTLKLTGTKTLQGRQAIGVHGGLPGPSQTGVTGSTTLYVATSKPTLPLGFSENATSKTSTGTQHGVDTGTFSNWGVRVHLQAPTDTVAFSSIPTK